MNNNSSIDSPHLAPTAKGAMWRMRAFAITISEHFPLTIQGMCVLLVAIIALQQFAFARMDLVVFAISICALAILGFSTLIVIFGGLVLRHRIIHQLQMKQLLARVSGHTCVEAGYRNETGFTLDTLGWLPLVSIHWTIVSPDFIVTQNRLNSEDDKWEEDILPLKRCKTQSITRRFTVRDVLGFAQFSWRFTQDSSLTALPRTSKIKQLPILRSLTSEDGIPDPSGQPEGDRMEIRPYAPGDSVRNIMWGAYARSRHLNVRLPERSVFHSHRTLAYLLSSAEDEAAAAVARVAVETSALGDEWVFGADGSSASSSQVAPSLELIAGSRAIKSPHSLGLESFLQANSSAGATHCVIFAGTDIGPLLPKLTASIGRYQAKIFLVLATDAFDNEEKTRSWKRILYRSESKLGHTSTGDLAPHKTTPAQLSRLLTQLGHLVESTIIVDRSTGLCFDAKLKRL